LENYYKNKGYSIIELLVVIVVVGIITAVALKSLRTINDTARAERTKKELDQLAFAVSGDPNMTSGGARTDFGYVGDVGSLPPNLDALVTNPGGYATWQGPYLRDDYLPSSGSSNSEFKVDEWGTAYSYAAGNTISSTGGGSTISRSLATSVNDLVYNSVAVTVTDINDIPPGSVYKDSVKIVLTYPNGAGTTTSVTKYPSANGFSQIDSIPIGQHTLKVIYTPLNDTLTRKVIVNPGELATVDVDLFRDLFKSGGGGGGSNMVTIRPDGAGTYSNNLDENCVGNWSCVDEVTSDGDGTYVKGAGGAWTSDSYNAENPSVTGTIDSVLTYVRVRNSGGGQNARTIIVSGGTRYYGSQIKLNAVPTYTAFSTNYPANPATSLAWSWTEINNLQIGVDLEGPGFCTQVWAEIYYH